MSINHDSPTVPPARRRKARVCERTALVCLSMVLCCGIAHSQDGLFPPRNAFVQNEEPATPPPMPMDLPQEPSSFSDRMEGELMEVAPDWGPAHLPADCGYSCPPTWELQADMMYLNYERRERDSLSGYSELGDFKYEDGYRITLNRHRDCLDGWELTYIGPYKWRESITVTGPSLDTDIRADGGINLSAFNTAAIHHQEYESKFNSIELNRRWWGWDVYSTTLGLRYFNMNENLLFTSTNNIGESGVFIIDTDNDAIGLQAGIDFVFPLGRFSSHARLRGSAYANIVDSSYFLRNDAVIQINNEDDDVVFASIVEWGYFLDYRLTQNISLRAGYEVWWIYGLALASEQHATSLHPLSGTDVDENGDIWVHGGSFGVEAVW